MNSADFRLTITVNQLAENCHAVFESALYSSLAVPEVLERGTAMASTYEHVVARGKCDTPSFMASLAEASDMQCWTAG